MRVAAGGREGKVKSQNAKGKITVQSSKINFGALAANGT
jgi:hypothetical protein